MRVLIILILTILNTSCSTVKSSPNNYTLNFLNLEAIISDPNFNQNSTVIIKNIDTCKVEFKSHWSKEVSERKGFYSVHSAIIVDFTNNYKNSLFVPAHDVIEDGVVQQRWSDLIEINFLKDAEVVKVSLENESSDGFMTFYNTDYLSIGVYNPDDRVQINKLLKAFASVHRSCISS
ncbi:hypothetical protein [Colwellia hornerae]|uniref:Uncharacterized protein n=1 Tax=Colwellia hornerae TaxID=89402 RepID=A0A5C6Q2B6_9GAMM|nr:hypothetical protein [Colwellia hornerae]TWX45745.1 hypothetical protein ESZ28_18505 [Colwellia hornerae]TWX53825.1 hypothetical protein ESZ26_18520 [Colwellia hornerae]TWX62461.1 hypothetical protein ESZ27_18790 [Colwellia hornerae]